MTSNSGEITIVVGPSGCGETTTVFARDWLVEQDFVSEPPAE